LYLKILILFIDLFQCNGFVILIESYFKNPIKRSGSSVDIPGITRIGSAKEWRRKSILGSIDFGKGSLPPSSLEKEFEIQSTISI